MLLRCEQDTLRLEVRNSNHAEAAPIPGAGPSGLGLANARQRLELLYPGRHELLIQESPAEYLVHLTLQLELQQPEQLAASAFAEA